jgi:hypothetical protein
MNLRLAFVLLFLPGLFLALPQSKMPLTNNDIISMVRQGMSDSAIIRAIEASENAFDTSPEERARLSQAGVSADVLKVMTSAEARKAKVRQFIPGRDGISYPEPITKPYPPYTDEARKAKAEGVIVLSVTVRKDGTVGDIKVFLVALQAGDNPGRNCRGRSGEHRSHIPDKCKARIPRWEPRNSIQQLRS